jgi:hypothetical protein
VLGSAPRTKPVWTSLAADLITSKRFERPGLDSGPAQGRSPDSNRWAGGTQQHRSPSRRHEGAMGRARFVDSFRGLLLKRSALLDVVLAGTPANLAATAVRSFRSRSEGAPMPPGRDAARLEESDQPTRRSIECLGTPI